jgi:hypothetical protein
MNESFEFLIDIFALSGGFWLIFGLYTALSIQRFIVKRYEQETNLGQAMYFVKAMPFAKYLPTFFSAPLYTGHLLSFVWGWKIVKFIKEERKKVHYYDDIDKPEDVTKHFSDKEIRKVKRFAIIGYIVVIHGVTYYICKAIWPEVFS